MLLAAFVIAATQTSRVSADFPISGVTRVIVRAANVGDAKIITTGAAGHVLASGTAQGGAAGYHPSDPNWKETKANDWGLGFRSKQFGDTVVISTVNEIRYIEHSYYIDNIAITVPPNVDVVLVARRLSGEGAPDLTPPVVRAETTGDLAALSKTPYQELHNLWELPAAMSNALQEVTGGLMAEAGADWQATDVIGPGPQPPVRRFVVGGQTKNGAIVVYEHGGIARHNHLVAFELPAGGAPRLVGSFAIDDKARTLGAVTDAMKKGLKRSDHF